MKAERLLLRYIPYKTAQYKNTSVGSLQAKTIVTYVRIFQEPGKT